MGTESNLDVISSFGGQIIVSCQWASTHANMTLVAAAAANLTPSSNAASEGDGATLLKQATLDFSGQQQVTKAELNTLIARYVVENMLPLSTVESESFRAILAKIPI